MLYGYRGDLLGCHTDLWRPANRDFSTLVSRMGWTALFPPIRHAWQALGTIREDVATRTGLPEDRAQDIVGAAWSGGIRFYDTAPLYGHGKSEHCIGHFLRQQPRERFTVSTKVGRIYRPAHSPEHRNPPWVTSLSYPSYRGRHEPNM